MHSFGIFLGLLWARLVPRLLSAYVWWIAATDLGVQRKGLRCSVRLPTALRATGREVARHASDGECTTPACWMDAAAAQSDDISSVAGSSSGWTICSTPGTRRQLGVPVQLRLQVLPCLFR